MSETFRGLRRVLATTMARGGGIALGIAVFGLMAGLSGCSPSEGPLQLKVAHSGSPESLIGLTADEFARRANEMLGDRATVVVFGSSLLGGDEVVLQKLKLGTVDMSVTSTVLSSIVDALALFEMPYLVRDRQHMRRIEEELFWSTLEPRVEAEGYKVLAVWEDGFRPARSQAAYAEKSLARKGVRGVRSEPVSVVVLRALYGFTDRRYGWPGESAE